MAVRHTKQQKRMSLQKLGGIVAMVSILMLIGALLLSKKNKAVPFNPQPYELPVPSLSPAPEIGERIFTSPENGFQFKYPTVLIPREIENPENYTAFIVFEESQYASGVSKGYAIGITSRNLQGEITQIKKELEKDNQAKLTEEKDISQESITGKELTFEPTDSTLNEPRVVLILQGTHYIYSISTHTSQKDQILKRFTLLLPSPTLTPVTPTVSSNNPQEGFCGGIAGIPCPYGFTCKLSGDYPDAGGSCVPK